MAIAIGVASAEQLPYLAGAINGARGFIEWATAMGCEGHAITDQDQPVTFERLRTAITEALAGPPIDRLYLYFAGHGFIREAEEGLWLLSHWYRELRAVAIEPLKRRLYRHGIGQIAIFSDACRKLPPDVTVDDVAADPVLGKGPQPLVMPPIDRFYATQDGTRTYMIPGPTPEQDRCLFSGLLLEGLWGTRPAAFSAVQPGQVTGASLGAYLRAEVPRISALFGKQVEPIVSPTFPDLQNVYFDQRTPPNTAAPAFPPWLVATPMGLGGTPESFGATPEVTAASALLGHIRGQVVPGDEIETGFAVEGLVEAWALPRVRVEPYTAHTAWRVNPGRDRFLRSIPLLLRLRDGTLGAFTCLSWFVAAITLGRGIAAVVYRRSGSSPRAARRTEEALAALESRADAPHIAIDAAIDAAIDLRTEKHIDPMLGVISSYLYDAIGDVDSIRRTAFFYAERGQPIPYDIALLGQLDGTRDGDELTVTVPAVARREPRTDAERRYFWTTCETSSVSGPVGGLWPWLRQGWAYLEPDDPLVHPALVDVAKHHLAPSRFSAVTPEGAEKLREAFGLVLATR